MPCFFDELLCHVVKKPYAYPLTFTFFDEKLMPVVLEEYSSSVTKDPTLIDEIDDGSVCHLIRTRASKLFKSVVPKERKDDIMREARRAGLEWHPDEAELLCIEFNKRISDEISTKELEFGEDKQGFEEWRVNFYSSDYNK